MDSPRPPPYAGEDRYRPPCRRPTPVDNVYPPLWVEALHESWQASDEVSHEG